MKRYLPVVLFMVAFVMVATILATGSFVSSAYELWRGYAVTTGRFVSFDPNNHMIATYTYEVDGETYTGAESPATYPKVGGSVTVYYSPKNPQNSSLSDPISLFWGDVGNMMFPLIFFPAGYILLDKVREWMLRRRLLRL